MRLFDDKVRDYMGPADFGESTYAYLDRSNRKTCLQVRVQMDKWYKDYPDEDKPQLRGRFISKDNRHHTGAFFELYCYHYLKKSGFDLEIHPLVAAGRSTRPEFIAKKNGRPEFYFECTIASDTEKDYTDQARKNQIYDIINRMDSPYFYVEIEIETATTQLPQSSVIRSCLQKALQELDPDEVIEKYKKQDSSIIPKISCPCDGWNIVFTPIPKPRERRGQLGLRPIGIINNGVRVINSSGPIFSALKGKATHYGDLDLPYIIAVDGIMDIHADDIDVTEALLGGELQRIDLMGKTTFETITDGLWRGPRGVQNQRVSAVLYVSHLHSFSITGSAPTLWHNPYALMKVKKDIWKGPQKAWDEDRHEFVEIDGLKPHVLFGLDPGWPGD